MRATSLLFCLWLGLVGAAAPPVYAQNAADQPADQPADPTAEPATDLPDLWHKFRHKDEASEAETGADAEAARRALVLAPAIGSRPSTGLTIGVNGNVAFYRGDRATTHLSSMVGGFRVSQKQQVLSNVRFAVFTADDRWFLAGDNRVNWTSLNTYALGSTPDTVGAANVKYTFARLYDTAYRTVQPGLFIGGGVNVNARSNIRPGETEPAWDQSAYITYTTRHGFPLDEQTSAGGNIGLLFDTRDNAINAEHGWLASAAYRTFFKGFAGGDATWQELAVDVRTYRPLTRSGSQRIAFWLLTDLVAGGAAPYFDLPTTGGDIRSGRGYTEGRNRGEHLAYGEIEYRGALTRNGIAGFVAFVNATTIGSVETGAKLFDNYAPAGGAGLRLLLNKRSRTNLCADWAWGAAGSHGFYLGLQEAF